MGGKIDLHMHTYFSDGQHSPEELVTKVKEGGIGNMIHPDAILGTIHGKLISGLFPYVKMSKSIPDSAINVGDSVEDLERKILECGNRNEEVILQMMILASNWNSDELDEAKSAFENREVNYKSWNEIKKKYMKFFIEIKGLWEASKVQGDIDVHEELFKE